MPANTAPIFPLAPYAASLSLAAATACATRAPTATAGLAAANILAFVPVSTNGLRIDTIQVKGASSAIAAATTAGLVQIWLWDGTTASLFDEIAVTAVTPSTTVSSFVAQKTYTNLVLQATHALYASTTVTTTAATNALVVTANGGSY